MGKVYMSKKSDKNPQWGDKPEDYDDDFGTIGARPVYHTPSVVVIDGITWMQMGFVDAGDNVWVLPDVVVEQHA